jgi:shikimate 5-dehydrogenase
VSDDPITKESRTTIGAAIAIAAACLGAGGTATAWSARLESAERKIIVLEALDKERAAAALALDKRVTVVEWAIPLINKRMDELSLEIGKSKNEVLFAIENGKRR